MGLNLSNLYFDRDTFGVEWFPYYDSHIVQYNVIDLVYIVIFALLDQFYFEATLQPFQRQFTINDLTISHPFAEVERVSGNQLIKIAVIVPTFIIFLVNLILTPKKHKVYVFYISLIGLFVSMTTDILITDLLKNWIGRCRPDFLARCKPIDTAVKDTLYLAKDVCTTTNMDRLLDGFRTTPSGHSSISFSTLGYTTIWLVGQLKSYHISGGGAWRTLVSLIPSLGAAYIALSRTQDYRHHFVDVILGSILGFLIAWWSYRRLFPSVTDNNCYVPYKYLDELEGGSGRETDPQTYNHLAGRESKPLGFYESRQVSRGGDYMMTHQSDIESGTSAEPLRTSL